MSRRPLNSSVGNEYRRSSQSDQPIANMRSGNDHPTNSHSGIHTNSSSLEVDFDWSRTVLGDANLYVKSSGDTRPQRNIPSTPPGLNVLPSLQIDFDLLRSVLADPTIKKADNRQSHTTNYSIQQPMKTQQHSSTSGFEWQPVTNNERQQQYADDIEDDSDSDSSGNPMSSNLPVIPPSLEVDFDLSRSVLADPSFKHTRDSIFSAPIAVAPPIKKPIEIPKLPLRRSQPKSLPYLLETPHSTQSSGNSFNNLPATVPARSCLNTSKSQPTSRPYLLPTPLSTLASAVQGYLPPTVQSRPCLNASGSQPTSRPYLLETPLRFLLPSDNSFNILPAAGQSRPCLNASNSTLSSGNTFNSINMSGSSQRPIQQCAAKRRNRKSQTSKEITAA